MDMTLAERIQEQRRRCGMSQEKLAEIFGVTVDLLLDTGESRGQSPAEEIYYLYKMEEEKKKAVRRAQRVRNLRAAGITAAVWLLIFTAGALVLSGGWTSNEYALLGVVFQSYPFGWLVRNGLFGLSMTVCVVPALFGRRKFAAAGTGGFALALLLGTLLGGNPAGAPYGHGHYGHGHYGWAIWGGVFLFALTMGAVLERLGYAGLGLKSKKLWLWAAVFAAGTAAITAAVVLTMPRSFS